MSVPAPDDPAREFSEADTPDAFRSAPAELRRPSLQVGTFAVEANALATRDMMQKAGVSGEIKAARMNAPQTKMRPQGKNMKDTGNLPGFFPCNSAC